MKRTTYLRSDFEVVSYETRKGKALSARCENWDGYTLGQVYDRWSDAKQAVYDDWFNLYCEDSKADSFSIVSHNCQTFSLGWFTTLPEPVDKGYDREVSILITPRHNYMIVYPAIPGTY